MTTSPPKRGTCTVLSRNYKKCLQNNTDNSNATSPISRNPINPTNLTWNESNLQPPTLKDKSKVTNCPLLDQIQPKEGCSPILVGMNLLLLAKCKEEDSQEERDSSGSEYTRDSRNRSILSVATLVKIHWINWETMCRLPLKTKWSRREPTEPSKNKTFD